MSKETQNHTPVSVEPVAVPKCPFHCGWDRLHKIAVQDAAYLAKFQWPEGEEGVSMPKEVAMRSMDSLIQVCRTMLNAAPVETPAPAFSVGVHGVGVIDDNPSALAVYFNAAPNDDDIRALHEIVSGTPVAAQEQPEGVTLDGCLETLFRLGEYLGVDYAASRKSPGAPSDVYIKAIEEKGFKARDAALEEAAVAMEQTSRQGGAMVIRALKSGSEAQQPVSGADGLPTERVLIDGTAYELPAAVAAELLRLHLEILGSEQAQLSGNPGQLDHLPDATTMVSQDRFRDAAQMIEPSGNSGELPDAARVPLDSLHADALYLLSRVKQETLSIHDAALSIQHHIDSARAALAEQDADKKNAERYLFLRDYASQSWDSWVDQPNKERSDKEIDEFIRLLKENGEWMGNKRDAARKEQA